MSESDDYKRGWYDGYNAKDKPQTYPTDLPGITDLPGMPGPTIAGVTCSKCGMVWLSTMVYSCPHINCPAPTQSYMKKVFEQ